MQSYIHCLIPILPVNDVKASLEYYRDVLGFEVASVWDEDGYAVVQCGDIEIHLDKQDHFAVYRSHSYLFVENADEIYDLYKSKHVEIIQEIESKPWGVREFTFRDINGHMFRVAHGEK
ncbi:MULTISPECIES: bleomycin resistance protein [Paenibacillus]|uniref:Bleomycin resistance protein n=1 Tax=Paenibacillus radicis (ex Xue et al. 2023) TaxID=2972489 RepID=A0ABT1YMD0_9BACL|nr:VOC family protein [Paenibacillus radicis (ex Xue et al. 2023)]MCR8634322.1 VOC family protein [Paenibacillus radicis (ex Xue et al. 2023)]